MIFSGPVGRAALIALVLAVQPAAAQTSARPVATATAVPHQRLLPLDGGQNFRDLGGYRTRDGRTVKWGLLFRSGSMDGLTPKDFAYLNRLGIRTVCDLRSTAERKAKPVPWPAGRAPKVLTEDYDMDAAMAITTPASGWTAATARQSVAAHYPDLLVQYNSQYRRMFAELLAGHAPLAFNCSAGKDRTGIASALVLTALGVPREIVIQDYLLSDRYFDPRKIGADRNSGPWAKMEPGVMEAFMASDSSYIKAALAVIDAHVGGARGYLNDELGLSDADIAKLRRLYTR
jgi:protein-tyrosine phosphatase